MRKLLATVGTVFLAAACGDSSDYNDTQLRALIKKAENIVTEELFTDGEEPEQNRQCWEIGRKTAHIAGQVEETKIQEAISQVKQNGITCTSDNSVISCNDGADCNCTVGLGSLQAECGANNYTYTSPKKTREKTPPVPPVTRPEDTPLSYSISPRSLESKNIGEIFTATITRQDNSAAGLHSVSSDLIAYDYDNQEIENALATWTTMVGKSIYGVELDIGDGTTTKAKFNIFFMKSALTGNVVQLGGVVNNTEEVEKSSVTVENSPSAGRAKATTDQIFGTSLILDEAAKAKYVYNNNSLSYITIDNNSGNVLAGEENMSGGRDVDGVGFVVQITNDCEIGDTVLVKIGNMVYETKCIATNINP